MEGSGASVTLSSHSLIVSTLARLLGFFFAHSTAAGGHVFVGAE